MAQADFPSGTLLVVEFGMGVDIDGGDATKAARRAVAHAIRGVVLPGLRNVLTGSGRAWKVHVRLGVPAGVMEVDTAAVLAELPHPGATIEVVPGGLTAPNGLATDSISTMVVAAIEIRLA